MKSRSTSSCRRQGARSRGVKVRLLRLQYAPWAAGACWVRDELAVEARRASARQHGLATSSASASGSRLRRVPRGGEDRRTQVEEHLRAASPSCSGSFVGERGMSATGSKPPKLFSCGRAHPSRRVAGDRNHDVVGRSGVEESRQASTVTASMSLRQPIVGTRYGIAMKVVASGISKRRRASPRCACGALRAPPGAPGERLLGDLQVREALRLELDLSGSESGATSSSRRSCRPSCGVHAAAAPRSCARGTRGGADRCRGTSCARRDARGRCSWSRPSTDAHPHLERHARRALVGSSNTVSPFGSVVIWVRAAGSSTARAETANERGMQATQANGAAGGSSMAA